MKMLRLIVTATLMFSPLADQAGQARTPAKAAIADMILRNGAIYLVEPQGKWAQAIAIRDGKIVAIGTDQDIDRLRGGTTRVIDLKGRMAMPGIIDGHAHVEMAALEMKLYPCTISTYATFTDVIAAVRACAAGKGPDEWIVGQNWSSALYDRLAKPDAIRQLDEASGGRPVLLRNDTVHDRWVNSRALQMAGITRDTADPVNGKIGHDVATGALNGLMLESAGALVEAKIPQFTQAQSAQEGENNLAYGLRYLNSQGVTGFNDAAVSAKPGQFSNSNNYWALDKKGELTAHVGMSMYIGGYSSDPLPTNVDLDRIFADREAVRSGNLSMDFAKIFLDGVMVSHTAVFLEPYLPDAQHGADFLGEPKLSQTELNRLVTELDRRGISVKIHVAGDGSTHMALDAIEAARRSNGDTGPIHTLAHAGYIASSDIPRVAALRAAIDASPTVWYPGPILTMTENVLGKERADRFWPFKTFVENGVLVAGGTDWKSLPGEFSSLWDGMQGIVTRRNPTGHAPGALWPEEAIDVATMVRFYTLNSAKALRIADRAGSLMQGKGADIIVLSQNLFKVPHDKIAATKVDMTIFGGKVVFERDAVPIGAAAQKR